MNTGLSVMAKPVGGRGKTAPYKTMQMRVPVPVKPLLEDIVERFRNGETVSLNLNTSLANTASIKLNTALKDDVQDFNDDEDLDPDIDDDYEETDEELIRTQSRELKALKEELKGSRIDVKLSECKLADVQEERSQLDKELNELHAINGDLNLEIANLKEKLAEVERGGSEVKQLRSQLEILKALESNSVELLKECHSDAFKAARILKAALPLPPNKGGAIKTEIRKALELIDDV